MPDDPASISPAAATPPRPPPDRPTGLAVVGASVKAAVAAVRQALANDGIRRLGFSWTIGIAADAAFTVVTLVTVFNLGGILAAGLLGAVRLVPAVFLGLFSGALLERFRGDRILVAIGLVRAASAALTALAIATAGTTMADHQTTMIQLFVFATIAGAASAPIRPTQITLMPAIARSPGELVAANTAWSTGEGLGALVGPAVAGALMAVNQPAAVAAAAAVAFVVTAVIAAGLRFEQEADASGDGRRLSLRRRLAAGVRAIGSRPIIGWSMVGVFGQVVTRGLLNALIVVAALELLDMGQSGPGLLSAALGIGGLVGIVFAMSSTRSHQLVRTMLVALAFWGLPLALLGIAPLAQIALLAMIVIGVANATYDVALFTIIQRGSTNEDRASVMSVLEAVIGLGGVAGSLMAPLFLAVLDTRGALIAGGLILPILSVLMFLKIGRTERITIVDEEVVHLLRSVPAFAELPMTAVERVAAGLEPFAAPAGTALMTQGELGDTFTVIASGEIEVLVDDRSIHRLGRGAGVGEIALLRRSPRTATVVAITDVTGYSVDAATFLSAIAGPAAAAVTERMAEANLRRAAAATS